MFEVRLPKEGDMRVVTAFKRMLRLDGLASVIDVSFDQKGRGRHAQAAQAPAPGCARSAGRPAGTWRSPITAPSGGGTSISASTAACWSASSAGCAARTAACATKRSAGPGPARRTPGDFEDVVAFLAQQMAKTPIRRLMRIAWDSVGDIITRVVADQHSEARFYGLVLIGVDEISYRRGQRYLTCVADHDSGRIVWAKPGRDAKTLQGFLRAARRPAPHDQGDLDRYVGRLRERCEGGRRDRRAVLSAITVFSSYLITRIPQGGSA